MATALLYPSTILYLLQPHYPVPIAPFGSRRPFDRPVKPPFNDALIKEPTSAVGPPLTESERRASTEISLPVLPEGVTPPLDHGLAQRNYLAYAFYRWPNARVAYTLDKNFTSAERLLISSTFEHIEENSCITFRPKTGADQDFVHIQMHEGRGCFADDHYQPGKGQHGVWLERKACMYRHIIAHELLHLLGVGHEHQRPDRDEFIQVDWSNIDSDTAFNFFKDEWAQTRRSGHLIFRQPHCYAKSKDYSDCSSGYIRKDFRFGYDFDSIMHYDFNYFAKDKSSPTIVPRPKYQHLHQPGKQLGGTKMTQKDILKLRAAYSCDGCGGAVHGQSGQITSTKGNLGCEWLIVADRDQLVHLTFTNLNIPDCSRGKITIYEGYKIYNKVLKEICGPAHLFREPLVSPTNAIAIVYESLDSNSHFTAKWKAQKVKCCSSVQLSLLNPFSPIAQQLYTFQGRWNQAGEVNGAPYYRHSGNNILWLGRFIAPGSFSTAGWAVSDPFTSGSADPGAAPEGKGHFFLGGNVMCPHLANNLFYKDKRGNFIETKDFSLTCTS